MSTTAALQPEETRFTPTPFFKKPSNYIKISLVVAAVLLAGAAVFAYFQGIGTIGTALIGAGSLVALTSCIIFHFAHKILHQRRQNHTLLDQVSKGDSSDNHQAIKSTIASGAKVDTTDAEGNTPLHHAAAKGDLALCQTLVSAGAKLDALNEKDIIAYYPIDRAIGNDHLPVVEFLFEKLSENSILHRRGQDWIEHILSKAARGNAENVFNAFMQSKEGRPALTESQLESILTTVIICCCFECLYSVNPERMPILLSFMAQLKAQNAKTDCALEFLQNMIAETKKPEVRIKLQEVETALTS